MFYIGRELLCCLFSYLTHFRAACSPARPPMCLIPSPMSPPCCHSSFFSPISIHHFHCIHPPLPPSCSPRWDLPLSHTLRYTAHHKSHFLQHLTQSRFLIAFKTSADKGEITTLGQAGEHVKPCEVTLRSSLHLKQKENIPSAHLAVYSSLRFPSHTTNARVSAAAHDCLWWWCLCPQRSM